MLLLKLLLLLLGLLFQPYNAGHVLLGRALQDAEGCEARMYRKFPLTCCDTSNFDQTTTTQVPPPPQSPSNKRLFLECAIQMLEQ